MNMRWITGLAAALVLGGCTTYDYVDRGGGYYTGSSPQYHGSVQGSYGYGYGYGSSYSGYRYRPGWSFGVDYGYPYAWSSYPGGYGYYGGGHYGRPPYYRPNPPHPVHPPRPGDHGQGPEKPVRPPPVTGGPRPPKLDGAPWRNLERLQREREPDGERLRRSAPYVRGNADRPPQAVTYRGAGAGTRPSVGVRSEVAEHPRSPAAGQVRQYGPPRSAGGDDGGRRFRQAAPQRDGGEPRARSAPPQRPSAPAPVDAPRGSQNATGDTIAP